MTQDAAHHPSQEDVATVDRDELAVKLAEIAANAGSHEQPASPEQERLPPTVFVIAGKTIDITDRDREKERDAGQRPVQLPLASRNGSVGEHLYLVCPLCAACVPVEDRLSRSILATHYANAHGLLWGQPTASTVSIPGGLTPIVVLEGTPDMAPDYEAQYWERTKQRRRAKARLASATPKPAAIVIGESQAEEVVEDWLADILPTSPPAAVAEQPVIGE